MFGWFHRFVAWLQDRLMFALLGAKIIVSDAKPSTDWLRARNLSLVCTVCLLQYNVSWEDPRVDCDLMKLNKKSSILMLTSAGCNVLDYIIDGAGRCCCIHLLTSRAYLWQLDMHSLDINCR